MTDRIDLDEQIYKNFEAVGAVTEPENVVRAGGKEELMLLLGENHRYMFTLIHKFHSRDNEEEQRHVRENMNEEELALFDLEVKESGVELSESDKYRIKKGVQGILSTLQAEKFVIDWKKHHSSRAQVKVPIEKDLDEVLPDSFGRAEYAQTCNRLFDHVVQRY